MEDDAEDDKPVDTQLNAIQMSEITSRRGSSGLKRGQKMEKNKRSPVSNGNRDSELSSARGRRMNQMPGPQRTGTVLTIRSLKEFDKSLQGKCCVLFCEFIL